MQEASSDNGQCPKQDSGIDRALNGASNWSSEKTHPTPVRDGGKGR